MSEVTQEQLKRGDYINSYYIGLRATGVPTVDSVLKAIVRAAKAYHHTELWADKDGDDPSQQDLIQAASEESASHITKLTEERDRLLNLGQRVVNVFDGYTSLQGTDLSGIIGQLADFLKEREK